MRWERERVERERESTSLNKCGIMANPVRLMRYVVRVKCSCSNTSIRYKLYDGYSDPISNFISCIAFRDVVSFNLVFVLCIVFSCCLARTLIYCCHFQQNINQHSYYIILWTADMLSLCQIPVSFIKYTSSLFGHYWILLLRSP